MTAMRRIVLASGNAGKLREFEALLAPLSWEVVPQRSLGITDADEPHVTFVENALAKARHASRCSGLPALADDSGLCVDVLAGAPGVYSARYAGEPKSDARNNALLIEQLRATGIGEAHWTARFVAVLVFLRHVDDPLPIVAQGIWEGRIVASARGDEGFGYDPHFFDPVQGKTAADLSVDVKNAYSHRAQAMTHLRQQLR